jgi:hypothetical protein
MITMRMNKTALGGFFLPHIREVHLFCITYPVLEPATLFVKHSGEFSSVFWVVLIEAQLF